MSRPNILGGASRARYGDNCFFSDNAWKRLHRGGDTMIFNIFGGGFGWGGFGMGLLGGFLNGLNNTMMMLPNMLFGGFGGFGGFQMPWASSFGGFGNFQFPWLNTTPTTPTTPSKSDDKTTIKTETKETFVEDKDQPVLGSYSTRILAFKDKTSLNPTDIDEFINLYNDIKHSIDNNEDEHGKVHDTNNYRQMLEGLKLKWQNLGYDLDDLEAGNKNPVRKNNNTTPTPIYHNGYSNYDGNEEITADMVIKAHDCSGVTKDTENINNASTEITKETGKNYPKTIKIKDRTEVTYTFIEKNQYGEYIYESDQDHQRYALQKGPENKYYLMQYWHHQGFGTKDWS